MTGILDQIARSRGAFHVRTLDDVFAIELARALQDMKVLGLYLKLVPLYPHAVLADAAKRFSERGEKTTPAIDGYYHELTHSSFRGTGRPPEVLAFKIQRNQIGFAVFRGARLSHSEILHLRSADEDADRSCAALVREMFEDYPGASMALESCGDVDTRRARLTTIAVDAAREVGIPVWTLKSDEVNAAFAVPPCTTRAELRAIVRLLYPQLEPTGAQTEEVDAVAIGIVAHMRILLHTEDRKNAG